jgi:hypothetical protein
VLERSRYRSTQMKDRRKEYRGNESRQPKYVSITLDSLGNERAKLPGSRLFRSQTFRTFCDRSHVWVRGSLKNFHQFLHVSRNSETCKREQPAKTKIEGVGCWKFASSWLAGRCSSSVEQTRLAAKMVRQWSNDWPTRLRAKLVSSSVIGGSVPQSLLEILHQP